MQSIDTSFSTDKFIERACILILVLLSTVTIFACFSINKVYGLSNEIKLIAIPVCGALGYIGLSLINKSISISKYIRTTIATVITISSERLNRMIRAVKLCLLITITFNTIGTLDKAFDIQNDLQEVCAISQLMLMIIPVAYILVQLQKAGRTE